MEPTFETMTATPAKCLDTFFKHYDMACQEFKAQEEEVREEEEPQQDKLYYLGNKKCWTEEVKRLIDDDTVLKTTLEQVRILTPYGTIFNNYTKKLGFRPFLPLWKIVE